MVVRFLVLHEKEDIFTTKLMIREARETPSDQKRTNLIKSDALGVKFGYF